MNNYFLAAAVVAAIVGIVHLVVGEAMIFRKLRQGRLIPDQPAPPLQERNIRILWATWHLASAFGFGFAAILLTLSTARSDADPVMVGAIALAFVSSAMLVLVATKGRHPGWIGLLCVGVLTYLGGAV